MRIIYKEVEQGMSLPTVLALVTLEEAQGEIDRITAQLQRHKDAVPKIVAYQASLIEEIERLTAALARIVDSTGRNCAEQLAYCKAEAYRALPERR